MSREFDGEAPRTVTRRTVAKAMAWAVPVIAVAAAVPAYAASQNFLTARAAACKLPGSSGGVFKGYALGFAAQNPTDGLILITIDSLVLNGEPLGNLRVLNLDGCVNLGGNAFPLGALSAYPNLAVLTSDAGNSQAGTLTATYTVTGGIGNEVTVTADVGTVPPLQSGACTGFTEVEKQCIEQQNRVAE